MRVRYGKPIKVKSLVGNQTSLVFNNAYAGPSDYRTVANGEWIYANGYGLKNFGHPFNLTLNANHIYLFIRLDTYTVSKTAEYSINNDGTLINHESNCYRPVNTNYTIARFTSITEFIGWEAYRWGGDALDDSKHAISFSLIDLTSTFGSGKEPTAQEFYNKYNQYFPLIATGKEITIDDKAGQVSYDKPILLKSLWGDQSNLTAVQPSVSGNYIYLGKDGYSTQSTYNINTNLEDFNTTITSGHKYILVLYQNGSAPYHMVPQPNGDKWRWTTSGTYISGQLNFSYYVADANITLKNFYQGGSGTPTLYKDFFIDLTDTFGAGNEPTATEFYNKYKGYFLDLASGKQIVVGKGKIAGGSSDIYYGYNQQIENGQFENGTSDWVKLESNISIVDGKLRCEPYTYKSLCGFKQDNFKGIVGHKYYIDVQGIDLSNIVNDNTTKIYFSINAANATFIYRTTDLSITNWNTIYECPNVNPTYLTLFRIYLTFNNGTHSGYFDIGSVSIIDLTDWFGAGKEPSTVAKFKEQFTKEYYGFCKTPIKLTRYQIEALPNYGYNQLSNNGNFVSKDSNYSIYNSSGSTWSVSNNEAEVVCSGTQGSGSGFNHGIRNIVEGHKLFITFDLKASAEGNVSVYTERETAFGTKSLSLTTSWQTFNYLITSACTSGSFLFRFFLNGFGTANKKYYLRNIEVIDLTDWYGAGSEPTTIEEFKATFPNKYYPYSKKRLLNKYMINKIID